MLSFLKGLLYNAAGHNGYSGHRLYSCRSLNLLYCYHTSAACHLPSAAYCPPSIYCLCPLLLKLVYKLSYLDSSLHLAWVQPSWIAALCLTTRCVHLIASMALMDLVYIPCSLRLKNVLSTNLLSFYLFFFLLFLFLLLFFLPLSNQRSHLGFSRVWRGRMSRHIPVDISTANFGG